MTEGRSKVKVNFKTIMIILKRGAMSYNMTEGILRNNRGLVN